MSDVAILLLLIVLFLVLLALARLCEWVRR